MRNEQGRPSDTEMFLPDEATTTETDKALTPETFEMTNAEWSDLSRRMQTDPRM